MKLLDQSAYVWTNGARIDAVIVVYAFDWQNGEEIPHPDIVLTVILRDRLWLQVIRSSLISARISSSVESLVAAG